MLYKPEGGKRFCPRVLYIVYWGACEPLGQSLVLPAVKRLARHGVDLTLVTFEKPADLDNLEAMSGVKVALERQGINWIPLRYHKRPKVPATLFDFVQGCAYAIARRLSFRPDIIHARTFIGGLMGFALAPLLRAKFIYHNEGFYPDEQVDAGVWKEGSLPHRIAKSLEQRMYRGSDGIIALSSRAKSEIENLPKVNLKATPVIVVPSCVDLDHFQFNACRPDYSKEAEDFVYSGSIGGRYLLDRIGRFVAVASSERKQVHLRVLTRTDEAAIDSVLLATGLAKDAYTVESAPYSTMPQLLANHQAGMAFLRQGLSEHGGSPTKIGEYWAMGLPVIATPNLSDTDRIIERERVGVVVSKHTDEAYRHALAELDSLLKDPDLRNRCRRAAETHYALDPACDRQIKLYRDICSMKAQVAAGIRVAEAGPEKSSAEM